MYLTPQYDIQQQLNISASDVETCEVAKNIFIKHVYSNKL